MADAFAREGLPVLTKTSPEAGRIFAIPTITNFEEAKAAIAIHPGLEIQGLGQLLRVDPLNKPQHAYRQVEGAPDAELLEKVLEMTKRGEESVMERILMENFGISLIAMYGGKLADQEIREIFGYHKNQEAKILQGKLLGIEARSREDHEGDFQDVISRGIIDGWYREICRNANLNIPGAGYGIFAREGLSAAKKHIREFAESILPVEFDGIKEQVFRNAEDVMEDVSMHRTDLTADYYVRGHFADLIHRSKGFFEKIYLDGISKILDEPARVPMELYPLLS